jgi:hypothetical protein
MVGSSSKYLLFLLIKVKLKLDLKISAVTVKKMVLWVVRPHSLESLTFKRDLTTSIFRIKELSLLGLLFDPEDGGDILLPNRLSPNYMILQPKRLCSSKIVSVCLINPLKNEFLLKNIVTCRMVRMTK